MHQACGQLNGGKQRIVQVTDEFMESGQRACET
jgi:hypothetical protein